jgi:trehalose 6-phosphate synthase/phosphatase
MPDEERSERIVAMQGRLRKQHSGVWAKRYLKDLDRFPAKEEAVAITDLGPLAAQLGRHLQEGRRVALFLDYDGTLRDFVAMPDQAVPDPALSGLLRELAAAPGLVVALVSGRPPEFLERHFGGFGVTLVGEHGYCWLEGGAGEWTKFNPHVTTDWKHGIRDHLEQASLLTPGTHVEEKQSSLVWHYRKADPEFGLWRARGMLDELREMAANLPVIVQHGQKIVEISSVGVSKGTVVEHLLKAWSCDAAVVAGDDLTDESMIALEPAGVDFFAIKVGKGSTRAAYRTDIPGMRTFLEDLRDQIRPTAG